jgi:hypothetical protein
MVARVFGKANGAEIIFTRMEGDRWEITVPSNIEGEYAVELYAEDDAGNQSFACAMLFTICGHDLRVKIIDRGYGGLVTTNPFTGEISIGELLAGIQEGGFTVERKICE